MSPNQLGPREELSLCVYDFNCKKQKKETKEAA